MTKKRRKKKKKRKKKVFYKKDTSYGANKLLHTATCPKCKRMTRYVLSFYGEITKGLDYMVEEGEMKKRGKKYVCRCGAQRKFDAKWIPSMEKGMREAIETAVEYGKIPELL